MVDEVTHHICKFVKVNLSNISAYCAILNIWIEYQYYLLVKKYISWKYDLVSIHFILKIQILVLELNAVIKEFLIRPG